MRRVESLGRSDPSERGGGGVRATKRPRLIPCPLAALRWCDVELLDRRLHVRRSFVRGKMGEPKSRAGRRTIGFGPRTADVLEEQWQVSLYRSPEALVFCHPALGTPLDASKVSGYMRKAITKAGIERRCGPGMT